MNILQVHNFYRQPGGEDQVFSAECDLLARHGHLVEQYSVHNRRVTEMPGLEVALRSIWNPESYRAVRALLRQHQIEIVHVHNTLPLISPSVYYAARAEGVPVVQTLHNFRLICPAATLYRDHRACEECVVRRSPWPGVLHGCYRNSRPATAGVAAMLLSHKLLGTWHSKISAFIVLTDFARRKFIEAGLPAEKIVVKSNFVPHDPGRGSGAGAYALYVGRLSEEKGIRTLLQAWNTLPEIPLRIAGDGPLRDLVASFVLTHPNVHWLGHCARAQVIQLLQNASFLIVPSEWYEPAVPLNVLDAAACGTPVLLSDSGSLREWVSDFQAGSLFCSGNPGQLADKVRSLISSAAELNAARIKIRQTYEEQYTADGNYNQLKQIYEMALSNSPVPVTC